ncbi:unnamed protein product [Paramecium octaurelia]|uniref:Uncharacterized protein n=1 Tax=Paramecium octaurelia TaxID=43137 RepID=A0A8S1WZH9_PAROT|nr:unnamed protein product [Paramecium octaurelia]
MENTNYLKRRFRSSGSLDMRDTMSSSQGFFSTNKLFVNQQGLSSNISSSTLRHTALQYSFPRAHRFNSQSETNIQALELPSQLGNKTTSQGFGGRIENFQWMWQETNAKELPSPNRYDVREIPGKDKLKRSFGGPWELYSKTYLPYNKNQAPEFAKFLPGPGEYKVRKDLGQHRYKFLLKGKGKMLNDNPENGVPGPEAYSPTTKLTSPSRFKEITQGIGEKKDPFRSTSTTPGPGKYELPSAFSKKLRVRGGDKRAFI